MITSLCSLCTAHDGHFYTHPVLSHAAVCVLLPACVSRVLRMLLSTTIPGIEQTRLCRCKACRNANNLLHAAIVCYIVHWRGCPWKSKPASVLCGSAAPYILAAGQSLLPHRTEAEGERAQGCNERANESCDRSAGSHSSRPAKERAAGTGKAAQLHCHTWNAHATYHTPPQIWAVRSSRNSLTSVIWCISCRVCNCVECCIV